MNTTPYCLNDYDDSTLSDHHAVTMKVFMNCIKVKSRECMLMLLREFDLPLTINYRSQPNQPITIISLLMSTYANDLEILWAYLHHIKLTEVQSDAADDLTFDNPLMFAIMQNMCDMLIGALIHSTRCDVNARNGIGRTSLMMACKQVR